MGLIKLRSGFDGVQAFVARTLELAGSSHGACRKRSFT